MVVEGEGSVEVLSVEIAALQDKVASLEEECQDRCRMANEWYEALKVRRNGIITTMSIHIWIHTHLHLLVYLRMKQQLLYMSVSAGFDTEGGRGGNSRIPPPPKKKKKQAKVTDVHYIMHDIGKVVAHLCLNLLYLITFTGSQGPEC